MPELEDTKEVVYRAVRHLYRWLNQYVVGFQVDSEDLVAYALYIALELLGVLPVSSKRRLAARQHNLGEQPQSGLSVRQFIYRAVIGPGGLRANSILKGMLSRTWNITG